MEPACIHALLTVSLLLQGPIPNNCATCFQMNLLMVPSCYVLRLVHAKCLAVCALLHATGKDCIRLVSSLQRVSYQHSRMQVLTVRCKSPAADAAKTAVTLELPGVLGSAPAASSALRVAALPEPAAHMTGGPASAAALGSAPCSKSNFNVATLPE